MMRPALLLPLLAIASSAAAQSDPGQRLYVQCQACHSIRKGEPHKIGPNLNGVIGSPAASRPGYAYSKALKDAKLVWDDATLDRWLARPSAVAPGNKMVFAGIADPARRKALIAYMRRAGR
jgi:cytochrome c